GEKKVAGAILIPSGFGETGNIEGQEELQRIGREYNVRLMGPNIYGFYYTPANLCATFCTAYDYKGSTALSSQSGGIGMAIIGYSRAAKMGVSAIVGLGNKSDIDEDDRSEERRVGKEWRAGWTTAWVRKKSKRKSLTTHGSVSSRR